MFQLGSTLFVECESEDDLRAVYALLALTQWDCAASLVASLVDSQTLSNWGVVAVGACGIAAVFYTSIRGNRAAESGVALAREMSEHELRAYVFLKEAKTKMLPPPTGCVNYQYTNSGKTPAKSVMVAARALWLGNGAPPLNEADVGAFRSVGPLGPGDQLDDDLNIEGVVEGADIRSAIDGGLGKLHLIGRIKYADEWSDERETSFHFYLGGDAGWDEDMTAATTGNYYK